MKVEPMVIRTGKTIFSCPVLGFTFRAKKTNNVRTTPAVAGMMLNATARGADQFTTPDKDHCIGNRAACRKRLFALNERPTMNTPKSSAIQSTTIGR